MTAVGKVGNRITWNHFFFVGQASRRITSPIVLPDWKHSFAKGTGFTGAEAPRSSSEELG